MKRISAILAAAAVLVVTLLCACSGGQSSPRALAETAYKTIQARDFDKYVDLLGDKQGNPLDEQDAALAKMVMQNAANLAPELESYEILSVEVSDDGREAVVIAKVTFKDKTPEEQKLSMRKGTDGVWRIG